MASGVLLRDSGRVIWGLVVAVLVGLVVSVARTGAAEAAFPGRNGRIAFISEGWIYLVNADGSNVSQLAETSSDDTSGGVSFSADGQLVAYSAYKGSDPDIYSVRVDGSKRRQVTFSRGIDVDPSWSPKADRIAFETNRNGNFDIYSVDPVGRNPLRLTNAAENEQDPAWSPKGDRIAFTVEAVGGKSRQIWVMNADGSNKQQLTNAPFFSENPNWSPDGSRIVFDSDRDESGNLELYSMRSDGSDVQRLTNHPALDALPAYSPDGTKIVFVSDRVQKDSRRLFVMAAGGGPAKRVIAADEPFHQMLPDWQPLRAGKVARAESPPGALLRSAGVTNRVDPLYDQADAWSIQMSAGVTYRINLAPARGCASITLFPPGTHSFASGRAVASHRCGGYFTFTPGPQAGGRYSLLVAAIPGTNTIVPYHLEAAAATPDDQGPGVKLANYSHRSGSVSARGVDAVDLYRFDVQQPSRVRIAFTSNGATLDLSKLSGGHLDSGGGSLTLQKGTYLAKVSAPTRSASTYTLALVVRVLTKTTLTVDGKQAVTAAEGRPVLLHSDTTPAPSGGRVRLRLDYQDPLSGWVFRRTWDTQPGGSITFTPPAVGLWRVRASFFGTRESSPSGSGQVTIRVTSVP